MTSADRQLNDYLPYHSVSAGMSLFLSFHPPPRFLLLRMGINGRTGLNQFSAGEIRGNHLYIRYIVKLLRCRGISDFPVHRALIVFNKFTYTRMHVQSHTPIASIEIEG